jgi:CspA family cold shock protein
MVAVRATGVVKFFNEEKGYGFITPDGGGNDVFVHLTGLVDGLDGLQQDQRVSFVISDSNRKKGNGKMATEVKVTS